MLKTSPEDVSPFGILGFIPSFSFRVIIYRAGVPFKGFLKGGPVYRTVMPPLVATTPPVSKGSQLTAMAAFASILLHAQLSYWRPGKQLSEN